MGDGPLRRLLDGFSVLLNDPRRTVLSLVTLPRDLPAQETVELYERLTAEHKVARGVLFINQIPALHIDDEALSLLDPLQDRAEELGDVSLARDAEITRRMLLVRARAQGQVSRLEESIDMPIVKIEQRASSHLTVEEDMPSGTGAAGSWRAQRERIASASREPRPDLAGAGSARGGGARRRRQDDHLRGDGPRGGAHGPEHARADHRPRQAPRAGARAQRSRRSGAGGEHTRASTATASRCPASSTPPCSTRAAASTR